MMKSMRRWKGERQMKLTKRGKRVRAVAIVLAAWAIWEISGNLWWVGDHYCWGEMTECYFGGK
jgi:hypothetical protein